MRNFDTESLSNDQIVCDILNCDDDYGGDDDDDDNDDDDDDDDDGDDGDNDGDDMVIYHACGENLHKLSYDPKKIWPGTRRQPLEPAKTIIVLDIPENEFSRHFANNGKNPNLKDLDEVFFLVETFIKYSYFFDSQGNVIKWLKHIW